MSFKLPFEIPALTLAAFCSFASACGEEHKSTRPEAPPAKHAQLPRAVEDARLPSPQTEPPLTALAPTTPRSILDSRSAKVDQKLELSTTDANKEQPDAKVEGQVEAGGSAREQNKLDGADSLDLVKVERFVLAHGVAQREPVGESDHFTTETPQIFAFMQFENQGGPLAVKVHWEKVGDPASPYGVELGVPTAPRHRTWSWTKIRRQPGTYRAVVRTLDGRELASKEFVIEAANEWPGD